MRDWRAILSAIKGVFSKIGAINNSPCDTCGQRLGDNPDSCAECLDYELERRAY